MANHEAPISGQAAASGFLNLSDGCTEFPAAEAEVGPGKLVVGEAPAPPNLQFQYPGTNKLAILVPAPPNSSTSTSTSKLAILPPAPKKLSSVHWCSFQRKRSIKVMSSGSISARRPAGKAHIFLKFVVALLNNPATRQMVLNEENSRRQTTRQHGERES